jgi:hypothetical protein
MLLYDELYLRGFVVAWTGGEFRKSDRATIRFYIRVDPRLI